ncbi:hypothetical protein HHL16_04960 [Pseudoflavitalea sp. G-6-1-2]|uniref:hypothetical protein n=1 Tax=Pseudoflavitalea sp. G-6-1-2 TaxID=2728841 RepID=UPI00146F2A9A|nr:hypothetical protein [Pseudoflavitalea sp. G-6-1-2]NML20209.1 hypothetical protein [Pseudoflavitalea sp. G-6-1-2]
MRKIFILMVSMLGATWLQAQTITFNPEAFTAEDEVIVTVDATGTPMAGKPEAYIWIWANKDAAGGQIDGLTNGSDFKNSKAEAKMTNKGGNIWEYKFTGTVMFGVDPGRLVHLQLLIKTKDGGAQTPDSKKFNFDPIVFVPSPFRVFPDKVGEDDVVTVNFHQALAPTTAEQRMTPQTVTVKLFDKDNVQIGDVKTWNVKSDGNGAFSYSFIPSITWTIPAGKKAGKFSYRFDGIGKDVTGNTVTVTGTTTEKTIDALK